MIIGLMGGPGVGSGKAKDWMINKYKCHGQLRLNDKLYTHQAAWELSWGPLRWVTPDLSHGSMCVHAHLLLLQLLYSVMWDG